MLNGNRVLDIRLEDHDQFVHIVITDNGIGRAAAKAKGRKSTGQGINMLRNIYDIYNPANQDHFSYTYDDLINPVTKAATGTRVTIHIPKQYKIQMCIRDRYGSIMRLQLSRYLMEMVFATSRRKNRD